MMKEQKVKKELSRQLLKVFLFLRLSMKASPVNQSQIWNFLSFLPFLTVLWF